MEYERYVIINPSHNLPTRVSIGFPTINYCVTINERKCYINGYEFTIEVIIESVVCLCLVEQYLGI